MDILLDKDGDLIITHSGDIRIGNSVLQKIKIKLLWFAGEWRWNKEEGIPYFDFLGKNGDTEHLESIIREKIFEVTEVTNVENVNIEVNRATREAIIYFTAMTDEGTFKEEVRIACLNMG